jgi:pimeloyl-ACP methyl ester carboxylesterase
VNHLCRALVFLCLFAAVFCLSAADRIAPPKSDVVFPEEVRAELENGLKELRAAIDLAGNSTSRDARLNVLLPDLEIYFKAVDWALRYDEFFKTNEFKIARELLAEGKRRAEQLAVGVAPWTEATGLVVRGYRSRVDGSVQPYGLVIPEGWRPNAGEQFRLDVWLHGRDDRLTELKFIDQRRRNAGQFIPPNGFVLHPYGRNCNAFKFAGETDVFEAMEHVGAHYPIDEERKTIRGFSMGGAGCWHLAAHHPDEWVAAAPGAGFSESADYLGKFRKEPYPPLWEQRLWGLYNATDYALNFFNLPVVSYDGDQDKQKQAADMMEQAMLNHGLLLKRVTGLNAGHKYTAKSISQINQSIDAVVNVGKETVPRTVKFETGTLRYPQSHWVRLEGLEQHWKKARLDAELIHPSAVKIDLQNVTAFSLAFDAGEWPLNRAGDVQVTVNGSTLVVEGPTSDRAWNPMFEFSDGEWRNTDAAGSGLRKHPGLQGPIDDVWYDSFVMVPPSREGFHAETDLWVRRELEWMEVNWRGLFRGDAPVKSAEELSESDVANNHLVLWGDPISNPIIAKIIDRLPLEWSETSVTLNGDSATSRVNVPVMIYPNPLNPRKYVVLNSGFTFRAMGSNADQTPKLPDYAIIDVTEPATGTTPGGVVAAGFFDEKWR